MMSCGEEHFCKTKEKPPDIIFCRKATHSDFPKIRKLIQKETFDVFGPVNCNQIHEKACLSLVQLNKKEEIISYVGLCTYPNVSSISPNSWTCWILEHYDLDHVSSENAMFIHFLVWDIRYSGEYFDRFLNAIFSISISCVYVILVLPPGVELVSGIEESMRRITPRKDENSNKIQQLYVSTRYKQNPKLKMRLAVEEDNDDIVEIIDSDCKKLKEYYGEYYISEMIRYPDGQRQIIVGEMSQVIKGVMCITKTIDIQLINTIFELDPYNGLLKYQNPKECENFENGPKLTREAVPEGVEIEITSKNPESWEKENQEIIEIDAEDQSNDEKQNNYEKSNNKEKNNVEENNEERNKGEQNNEEINDEEENKIEEEDNIEEKDNIEQEENKERKDLETEEVKDRSLSLVAFDTLISSEKDEGLIQLLLAQSTNLKLKIENTNNEKNRKTSAFPDNYTNTPNRGDASFSTEFSELMFQKMKPSSFFTWNSAEPNAFVIELFSVQSDLDDQRCQDFLEAAFDCFPDLDYCALLLPSTHPFLPFLEYFVRVPLRYNKDFSSELYLTHRAIFSGSLKSRKAVPDDLKILEAFLTNIPTKNSVVKDAEEAVLEKNRENECFVFLCDNFIIGMTITSTEKDVNFLKRHYKIENYVSTENVPLVEHGRLLYFIIMPIFAVCHKFFFQEILRLSQKTILYYRLCESDASALTRTRPLLNCLDVMILIEPKTRTDLLFQEFFERKSEISMSFENEEKFSLFLMTPRFLMISKSVINMKIVVVGASDCGLAFLEYLALRSKSKFGKFTNLTLISSNGLPYEKKTSFLASKLIPFKGRYCYNYGNMKNLRTWINIVKGTVTDINRKEKYVSIKNSGNLSYDYLILTCGVQFQPKLPKRDEKLNLEEIENPINCLIINDDTEAASCVKNLESWTNCFQSEKSIVFYGISIESYCAINVFLEMGVKGSWITLIEPLTDSREKIFFYDDEVEETVMKEMYYSGINILSGWELLDWELENDNNGDLIIKNLEIKSKNESRRVSCDILVNFSRRRLNLTNFLIFSRAGLIFDEQLIIDLENRTNDPFIFAGGTVTKYSRKYMVEAIETKYFNPLEVGEELARNLMKIVESQLEGKEAPIKPELEEFKAFPTFKVPKSIFCILPGGYYYLHVRKSGKQIIRRLAILQNTYGTVFKTGSCNSDIGYFRIRINPSGFVENITCFSKKSFELQNFISLYGKHQSLLNNLNIRFQNSLIMDFYSYFREPWAAALFADNFELFQVENRKILLSKFSDRQALADEILNLLIDSNCQELSEEDQAKINSIFIGSLYQEEIEKNFITFLQNSGDELSMYCTPQKIIEILQNFESSPLFTLEYNT